MLAAKALFYCICDELKIFYIKTAMSHLCFIMPDAIITLNIVTSLLWENEATVCQSQYQKLNLACGAKFNQKDLIKSAHNNY